jgi:hypothetical protein
MAPRPDNSLWIALASAELKSIRPSKEAFRLFAPQFEASGGVNARHTTSPLDSGTCSMSRGHNGEGGIRTRPSPPMLRNAGFGHKSFLQRELSATQRYYARTLPTRFVTRKIGQSIGQSPDTEDVSERLSRLNSVGTPHHVWWPGAPVRLKPVND